MFRSVIITRELYLYLTKVIFMLKDSVRLRRYIYLVIWQHVCNRDMLPHHINIAFVGVQTA